MLSYQEYADNMKNGIDTLEALNYDEAVEAFTAASKAVDGIDDTTNRNVADDYLNTSNGRKAMKDGKNYESRVMNPLTRACIPRLSPIKHSDGYV